MHISLKSEREALRLLTTLCWLACHSVITSLPCLIATAQHLDSSGCAYAHIHTSRDHDEQHLSGRPGLRYHLEGNSPSGFPDRMRNHSAESRWLKPLPIGFPECHTSNCVNDTLCHIFWANTWAHTWAHTLAYTLAYTWDSTLPVCGIRLGNWFQLVNHGRSEAQ